MKRNLNFILDEESKKKNKTTKRY